MNIHERIKKEGIDVEKPLFEQPDWYIGAVTRGLAEDIGGWQTRTANRSWFAAVHSHTYAMLIYRPCPKEPINDSIDWSHLHKDFKFIRVDVDERTYGYTHEPHKSQCTWDCRYKKPIRIDGIFSSYKRGNIPWDEMILDRPE